MRNFWNNDTVRAMEEDLNRARRIFGNLYQVQCSSKLLPQEVREYIRGDTTETEFNTIAAAVLAKKLQARTACLKILEQ